MSTDQRRTLAGHLHAAGVHPEREHVVVEVIGERGHDGRHIAGDLALSVHAGGVHVLDLDADDLLLADGSRVVGRVDVRALVPTEHEITERRDDDGTIGF